MQAGIEDTTPWYDVGLNGRDEVIALSDTGIDMTHCYFKDHEMEQDDFVYGGPVCRFCFSILSYIIDYIL